jgi:molybdopterin converting factor subunit 1
MIVNAQLFASFREAVGSGSVEVELDSQATAGDLVGALRRRYPQLEPAIESAMVAVNLEYVGPDFQLNEGDRVAIIPPVSGGLG